LPSQLLVTGSWVVPASGVVNERFAWSRKFIKVDLPELGGPKISNFNFSFSSFFSTKREGSRVVIFLTKLFKLVSVKVERVKKCCGRKI